MSQFTQTSNCQSCGAGIYVPTMWMSTIPPAPHYTCRCPRARTAVQGETFWPPTADIRFNAKMVEFATSVAQHGNNYPVTDNFLGNTQHPTPLTPQAAGQEAGNRLGDALERDDEVQTPDTRQDQIEELRESLEDLQQRYELLGDENSDLDARMRDLEADRDDPAPPVKKVAVRKKADPRKAVLQG